MADYYYIELNFDSSASGFAEVVDSSVAALMQSGCRFKRLVLPTETDKRSVKGGRFEEAGLGQLYELSDKHYKDELKVGKRLVGFPPRWGRVVLEYDFVVDGGLVDEVHDEEEETHTGVGEVGLYYSYSGVEEKLRSIRMTMSTWEDYLLTRGDHGVHAENLRSLLSLIENVNLVLPLSFGAMNSELRLDADRSYHALLTSGLPEGNEFVFVGAELVEQLDLTKLEARGYASRGLADGARIIQFADRWGGLKIL